MTISPNRPRVAIRRVKASTMGGARLADFALSPLFVFV
jgi:hypothetical protein